MNITTDFSVGERVFTIGLSMKCRCVVGRSTIVHFIPRDKNGFDCVICGKDGLKVMYDSRKLFKSKADAMKGACS